VNLGNPDSPCRFSNSEIYFLTFKNKKESVMMKTNRAVACIRKAFFVLNSVSWFLRGFASISSIKRAASLMLVIALLVPVFLFSPVWRTSARKIVPLQQQTAVSNQASPQSYIFAGENNSVIADFVSVLTSTKETVSNFFRTPQLPEGFAMAKPVSPFSAFASSIAGFIGSGVKKVEAAPNPATSAPLPAGTVSFDFDADGKADFSRYRKAAGTWAVKKSLNNSTDTYTLGSSSDSIAPANYDNDNKTDFAIFNPSTGTWTIHGSTGTNFTVSNLGQANDNPVAGDYDGDSKADPAVWRPSNGTWYIAQSGSSYAVVSVQFGQAGDIPVPGDYDGDGALDKAVYRPTGGYWYVLGTTSGFTAFQWGLASDIPVPANYDNDNKTDYAVYRGSTGTWYVYKSNGNGQYIAQNWGNYGDQPVPADYDGDGKADLAVWRPTTGVWHLINSSDSSYTYASLGINGDVPVIAAYLKQIGGYIEGYELAKTRLHPKNSTGGTNLYSRNFSWSRSLVALPGRTGLNAAFGISYNSLIWTKHGSSIYFDTDNSNISPGFRFGFPTIEPIYYDAATQKFNYMVVSPTGARTEFRQINGASDIYEAADSSYIQLKTKGAASPNETVENISIALTGTDGTRMNFSWKAGAFRCSQIKDRNGNFITIEHDELGLLRTVTDTLGRVISVEYDNELYPTSIKQTWKDDNGKGTNVVHTWASFTYSRTEPVINTSFDTNGIMNFFGPPNYTTLKVLKKMTYADGSSTRFSYNSYGQVWKIETVAADSESHVLNHISTDLENPAPAQPDCPRFSTTRTMIENFNNGQETVVHNEFLPNQTYNVGGSSGQATLIQTWMEGNPYGAVSKTYVGASGWQEGLPLADEDWVTENGAAVRKRWSLSGWTQDDPNLDYILNPRMIEFKEGDAANIKKTTAEYYTVSPASPVALYGLVKKQQVFNGVSGVLLKEAATEYNLSPIYISKRVIGLPSKMEFSGLNQENNTFEPVSKITYIYDGDTYDNPDFEQNISPVQHDNTGYGAGFITGRGNLTSTTRHDVTGETSGVTTSIKYNTAGAPVAQIDPAGRITKFSYIDNYNDSTSPGSRNTSAYPTKVTDPAGNYSSIQYRFDLGANVWAQSPKPDGQDNLKGKTTERIYDGQGRLEKEKTINYGGAYTRYEYPANGVQIKSYTTILDDDNDGADASDEVMSETWVDGAGRILRSRTAHPSVANAYTGQMNEYDLLGRLKRATHATEINSSWQPTGEDYRGNNIWLWASQEYDWKGRVTRAIPSDSNGTDGKDQLYTYNGCGCAGDEIVTVESELVPRDDQPSVLARKKQKIYTDILGRNYKTEMFDWDGNIYKTVVNLYNGRDQVYSTRQYAGGENSAGFREATSSFDGHGRLKMAHAPEQSSNKNTSYIYFADDKPQTVTDARGATKHYTYNNRGLIHQISWTVPQNSNIEVPSNVTFNYDAAGNRTQMDDGFGSVFYEYNELSQLKAETRQFNESIPSAPQANNSFKIQYSYGLSGQLTSLTEPFGEVITYGHNKTGKLTSVSGLRTSQNVQINYVTDAEYRAWGAIKKIYYGNGGNMTMKFNDRLQADEYNFLAVDQQNSSAATIIKYGYYNDGRLKSSDTDYIYQNQTNNVPNFDRLYEYDYLGRLTSGKTGLEAHGQPEPNMNNRPYRMTLAYNHFGDIVSQQKLHWTASFSYAFQYQNNRLSSQTQTKNIPGWENYTQTINHTFDDDGRRTDDETKYDADGRIIHFTGIEQENDPSGHGDYLIEWNTTALQYSGSGGKVKIVKDGLRFAQGSSCQVKRIRYYIRSSVINEEVAEFERDQVLVNGNLSYEELNRKMSVYANGEEIAERAIWNAGTPFMTDKTILKSTDASGVEHINVLLRNDSITTFPREFGETTTTDPFGAVVGANYNFYPNPPPTGWPDPNDPNCTWNDYDDYECDFPDEYGESQESEENEAGSVPENTCYVNGVREDCNEILAHPDRYGLNDHEEPSEDSAADAAPSEGGPESVHQNDDASDNDSASAGAGERQFEIEYTGMNANMRGEITLDVVDDGFRNISLWDLRIQTSLQTRTVEAPYSNKPKLQQDFNDRLNMNNGDCKKMLNNLLATLKRNFKSKDGKLTGIEALADRFFNDKKYKILESSNPGVTRLALGSYMDKTIRLLNKGGKFYTGAPVLTHNAGFEYNVGYNFLHELLHGSGKGFYGLSHQDVVEGIATLEGLNLGNFKANLDNEVKKKGLKGTAKAEFIDKAYDKIMDYWLGNYCNYEGGYQRWKDFVQNNQ
jgi:YD repeat-containing protein